MSECDCGGILRLTSAMRKLPWRDSDARDWLLSEGLVIVIDGRNFVIWDDVKRKMREVNAVHVTSTREARKPLPRVKMTEDRG